MRFPNPRQLAQDCDFAVVKMLEIPSHETPYQNHHHGFMHWIVRRIGAAEYLDHLKESEIQPKVLEIKNEIVFTTPATSHKKSIAYASLFGSILTIK